MQYIPDGMHEFLDTHNMTLLQFIKNKYCTQKAYLPDIKKLFFFSDGKARYKIIHTSEHHSTTKTHEETFQKDHFLFENLILDIVFALLKGTLLC